MDISPTKKRIENLKTEQDPQILRQPAISGYEPDALGKRVLCCLPPLLTRREGLHLKWKTPEQHFTYQLHPHQQLHVIWGENSVGRPRIKKKTSADTVHFNSTSINQAKLLPYSHTHPSTSPLPPNPNQEVTNSKSTLTIILPPPHQFHHYIATMIDTYHKYRKNFKHTHLTTLQR